MASSKYFSSKDAALGEAQIQRTLNVAGPRASKEPNIARRATPGRTGVDKEGPRVAAAPLALRRRGQDRRNPMVQQLANPTVQGTPAPYSTRLEQGE